MELGAGGWLTVMTFGALVLGSCGKHPAETGTAVEAGAACDPCGAEVDPMLLLQVSVGSPGAPAGGVRSTCGTGLTCVLATFSLAGPGVCVRTAASTTCTGHFRDSMGAHTNRCTYTPKESGFDVFCN